MPYHPNAEYEIWTLDEDGVKRTYGGGAKDALSATMIACTITNIFGVPSGVFDGGGEIVSYLGTAAKEGEDAVQE